MAGITDGAPRPWELWWAQVRFEDTNEIKRRPVLVLEGSGIYVIAAKATSHAARQQWGEYELLYWRSAGLPKETTVRLTQLIRLERSTLDRRIGMLHPIDIENIMRLLQ